MTRGCCARRILRRLILEPRFFPGDLQVVRFLSSPLQNQRFSQGFSHFWPIALEFCSAHATRCMAPAALYFASRSENRVVFRVALGRQNTGVLHVLFWYRSKPMEAVSWTRKRATFRQS